MIDRLLKILLFLGLLSFILPANFLAQDRVFIQFVFQGDVQIDVAEVDSTLKSFETIYMSRTDVNTRNYLAICANDLGFDIIENHFLELGYDVRCKNTGIHGQDVISPIDPKQCGFHEVGIEEK